MEQYEQRPKGEKVWGMFTKHEVTRLSWCVNGMTGGKTGEVNKPLPYTGQGAGHATMSETGTTAAPIDLQSAGETDHQITTKITIYIFNVISSMKEKCRVL